MVITDMHFQIFFENIPPFTHWIMTSKNISFLIMCCKMCSYIILSFEFFEANFTFIIFTMNFCFMFSIDSPFFKGFFTQVTSKKTISRKLVTRFFILVLNMCVLHIGLLSVIFWDFMIFQSTYLECFSFYHHIVPVILINPLYKKCDFHVELTKLNQYENPNLKCMYSFLYCVEIIYQNYGQLW